MRRGESRLLPCLPIDQLSSANHHPCVSQVHIKPELGPTLALEWIEKFKAVAATEPGTLEYSWAKKAAASESPEDVKAVEGVYVVWERYRDLEALNA